jgi:hypothetical protein
MPVVLAEMVQIGSVADRGRQPRAATGGASLIVPHRRDGQAELEYASDCREQAWTPAPPILVPVVSTSGGCGSEQHA